MSLPAAAALLPRRAPESRTWQSEVAQGGQRAFRLIERIARQKKMVLVIVAVLPMAIRLAALRAIPIPEPYIHDEYSYILAADTFRSGRLTNSTPPLWQHFETFHELMQPSYQSKYPPAQGLSMALGWKLFGHPWYGVWLGFGFMCGCICWMLQGWMPPVYAFLGTLAAMGQIGIFGYWMDSYWGGAIAAAGGALALGALPRLARQPNGVAASLGTIGAVILANSRPYEGAVTIAAALVALIWWRRRRRPIARLTSWRNVVPAVLIGGCALVWMGYYDYRVTGKAWKMPYEIYYQTYSLVPQWFILPPNPHHLEFRHPVLRKLWTDMEVPEYRSLRRNPGRALMKLIHEGLSFYLPTLFCALLGATLLLSRSRKIWIAAGILILIWCAVLIETWHYPHYLAPGAALLMVPIMYAIRMLRVRAGRPGAALALLLILVPFANGLMNGIDAYRNASQPHPRADVNRTLLAKGGKHLVLVRYEPDHSIYDMEWVFNSADIKGSPVIWARDMGPDKNRELFEYFRDRQVWVVHPDPPFAFVPYSLDGSRR